MHNDLSRRRFLARSTLLGTSVSLFPVMLSGCGGGEAAAQSSAGTAQLPVPVAPPAPPPPPPAVTRTEWRTLRIGAGGYVTGLDIAPDGTKVVRCDSAGAFIWNDAAGEWKPLLTMKSMPTGDVGHQVNDSTGVYEVIVAPSNSNIIYMVYGGQVYKSTNKGVTFAKTGLAQVPETMNEFRTFGRKLAVDPTNPDIVYFGTQTSGLFVTFDGGATWRKHADIPVSATAAGIIIAFDPSSGTTGGKTRGIYVSSQGSGVFRSTDAGQSFALTFRSPTSHRHMICDGNGVVWLTDASLPRNNVRQYRAGLWIGIVAVSDQSWHGIAANPANNNHIVLVSESGAMCQSFDGGLTWPISTDYNYPPTAGTRVSNDVPWLGWANANYMAAGAIKFDPSANNKLYFADGLAVWWTNPPATFVPYNWASQAKGIEQLVSNKFVTPPGGTPLYLAWDKPIFVLDNVDAYPSTHAPNRKYDIICAWSGDYAVDDPRFVVAMVNYWGREESGYSTDGGKNWTKFASIPSDVAAGKIGGSIAVSTRDNIVWVPNNNGNPYYTKDRGATWTQISLPGVPTTSETGWGWAYYLYRHIVVSDTVTPGTFYMYNYKDPVAGIYRTTNGGTDWTRTYAGMLTPSSGYNAQLVAVPGKAGNLFFTSGPIAGQKPGQLPLMRSTDAGVTWSAVANVLEVYCTGFGKAATGSDYPTIYIVGFVNREFGIWRSTDNASSWTKIGDYPLDCIDLPKTISGDPDRYGRVYLGFGGSGAAYAELVTS